MLLRTNRISPNTQNYTKSGNSLTFCSDKRVAKDTFEIGNKKFKMRLYSPFSDTYCESNISIDFNKKQTFKLKNKEKIEDNIIVEYDPLKTGVLRDKTNGKPIDVNILKSTQEHYDGFCTYHFMSKDLKKEYGYVQIFKPSEYDESDLDRDYPEYGLIGKRIEVLFLKNHDDKKIGGVGKLSDKVCVQYCLENNIEPNIVSYSEKNSQVAHFKRGKRFIPPKKGSDEYKFLNKKYHNTNPDLILRELIEESDKTGEKVDLSGWGYLIMYMPKEISDKYR